MHIDLSVTGIKGPLKKSRAKVPSPFSLLERVAGFDAQVRP